MSKQAKKDVKSIDIAKSTEQDLNEFLKDAYTGEIVAAYNLHAEKPVKAFNNRGIAVERIRALAEQVRAPEYRSAAQPAATESEQPAPKTKKAPKQQPLEGVEPERTPEEEALFEKRSTASKASWADADVAARRSQRHFVRVDGAEYRSTRDAFKALGLPESKVIKFRMRLKAAGTLEEFGRKWEAIEA